MTSAAFAGGKTMAPWMTVQKAASIRGAWTTTALAWSEAEATSMERSGRYTMFDDSLNRSGRWHAANLCTNVSMRMRAPDMTSAGSASGKTMAPWMAV